MFHAKNDNDEYLVTFLNFYQGKILKPTRSGFPNVGQVAPLGAMTNTQGAMSSKGAREGP